MRGVLPSRVRLAMYHVLDEEEYPHSRKGDGHETEVLHPPGWAYSHDGAEDGEAGTPDRAIKSMTGAARARQILHRGLRERNALTSNSP